MSNDATISSKIKCVQENLQKYLKDSKPKLTGGRWPIWLVPYDPVRKKNLQKIDGYLVRMLHLKLDSNQNASDSNIRVQPLTLLLHEIEKPETLSSDAVWELELVELGEDTDLYTLLKELQENDDQWDRHFSNGNLSDPLKIYNGTFPDDERHKIRSLLTSLLLARVSEYRRDRAKAQLRGNYLVFMSLFLALFVSCFTIFFVAAESQAAHHQPVDPFFILLSPSAPNCFCPSPGPKMPSDASRRRCQRNSTSKPNQRSPWACSITRGNGACPFRPSLSMLATEIIPTFCEDSMCARSPTSVP